MMRVLIVPQLICLLTIFVSKLSITVTAESARHKRAFTSPSNTSHEVSHMELSKAPVADSQYSTLPLKELSNNTDVVKRPYWARKRILVAGGAGFIGSHLVDRLMTDGHEVIVVDNLFTGRRENVAHWLNHPNFEFIRHDVVQPLMVECDQIYHLASPASPPHYMFNPVKTIKTNAIGTINMLGLARRTGARFLFASSSEIYGDPEVHPQPETYWGHVNPIGPRACYDEGKRIGETLTYAYAERNKMQVRVARIFNTYGPRMDVEDGRVVSNFLWRALLNQPLVVYGSGNQTRSLQYVSDLVDGLIALMNSSYSQPVNLGNPNEMTVNDFAQFVLKAIPGTKSRITHGKSLVDEPQKRKPVITVAERELGWIPKVNLREGILRTISYFRNLATQAKHEESVPISV